MRVSTSPWPFLVCALGCSLVFGCQSNSQAVTRGRSESRDAALRDFAPHEVMGIWALTDERNSTFNVHLIAGGHAVSTWSGGPAGAIGERGEWKVVDGRVKIEWSNGWIDELRAGPLGVDQRAWGPGDLPSDPPRTYGKAVQIRDAMAEFVGVWQTRGVLPGDPATIYVAIQSDGMVFKSIGEWRYGCWAPVSKGLARITWANGWYDELNRDAEGYFVRTWTPAADHALPPSATNRVRRVE